MRNALIIALLALAAAFVAAGVLSGPAQAAGSPLDRPYDPVVLTGADAGTLTGRDPDDIVAFRYDGGWDQIPVQVDERAVLDYCEPYDVGGGGSAGQAFAKPCGYTTLMYTDAGTFTGADPNPALDDNDEIVFMAKDAGFAAATQTPPAGVLPIVGVEVAISDPQDGGAKAFAYLFVSDGSLTPDAGEQYVSYVYDLNIGPYLTNFNTLDGPNPEDSVVTTPFYAHHFSDRWITDELSITAGAATGVDILDRQRALFAPGNCARHEDTFANGEGAYIANISGPVRAVRSYIGANSGPLTVRQHLLYEQREDIQTSLRVHVIPSVLDFFDYSPAASGMTYYNSLNTAGVTIDGVPDSITAGAHTWELVAGAQGSLFIAGFVDTNISGFAYTSYYQDDSTPPQTQCTGDAFEYGASGTWINQTIPCTDPALSCSNYLHATRVMYFEAPGLTSTEAPALESTATTPLEVTTGPFTDGVGGVAELDALASVPADAGSSMPWTWASAAAAGLVAVFLLARRSARRR